MTVELDDVRDYLGAQPGAGPINNEVLQEALDAAEQRVTSCCMAACLLSEPRPNEIDQAVVMQAARLYRRRYSIGGFEGFGDLGIARVPGLDPDIEDLLTRYLSYDFA